MANKTSLQHLRRGATALTAEAGKLIRDQALGAAHQALVLALQTVQAADRSLRGTGGAKKKAPRRKAAATLKRKAARPAAKARRAVAAAASRAKPARRRSKRATH